MPQYTYTDADPNTVTYIPPGEYTIVVIEFSFGLSSSGNEKMDLKYRVKETGTILKDTFTFTPKSQWKFDILLKCVTPSKGIDLPEKGKSITVDDTFCHKYLMGGSGRVAVQDDIYQNQTRSKIFSYHGAAESTSQAQAPTPEFF